MNNRENINAAEIKSDIQINNKNFVIAKGNVFVNYKNMIFKSDELNAIRDLSDEYDIGRVLYMARTNPKGLRKAVAVRVKELKQFMKSKNLRELKEGRYHQWRNDESLTPKQKIGRSIREVKNSLNELDKTIKMNQRLKNELKVDSKDYWKTTHKALSSISERLVRLASRVGNLR